MVVVTVVARLALGVCWRAVASGVALQCIVFFSRGLTLSVDVTSHELQRPGHADLEPFLFARSTVLSFTHRRDRLALCM